MAMQATAIELCYQLNDLFDAGISDRKIENNTKLMADDLIPDELMGKAVDLAFERQLTKGLSEKFIKAHINDAKPETKTRYEELKNKYKGESGGWKKAYERETGQHRT